MKTNAAVAFAANEPLRIVKLDLADPGPGEVMVKILASGLCHTDLHAMEGNANQAFPAVMGHEGVGEVIALGEGVSDFAIGDRVIPFLVPDCGVCPFCKSGRTNLCVQFGVRRQANKTPFSLDGAPVYAFMGLGTFAETTVVPADMLTKVDIAARPDHACCIGCGVTTGLGAALLSAKVTPGSSVAVFGCGGVGLSVIQGARIAGATKIIAIDTNAAKAEIARKLGATDFINPNETENVPAAVIGLTGLGADFAFECVGIAALSEQALASTNPAWGTMVCVGIFPPGTQLSTPPMTLMMGRRWTGSFMGGAKRADVSRFVDMYVAGDYALDDLVSHRLDPGEINRGFDMMKSGEAIRSVVVYDTNSEK